jgi:hypothetical protein
VVATVTLGYGNKHCLLAFKQLHVQRHFRTQPGIFVALTYQAKLLRIVYLPVLHLLHVCDHVECSP